MKELARAGRDRAARSLKCAALPATRSTVTARIGINEVIEADGGNWEMVSVVGNWDDGTTQKVVADAIAVHGQFVAVVGQGGSNGVIVQALKDAGHPWVPIAGESENGFRKAIAQYSGRRAEGHLDRPVAGPCRGGDEGGDFGAGRQCRCRS